MIELDLKQGSKEWLDARLGVVTASNFSKLITSKARASRQQSAYMETLIQEQISNKRAESFSNNWIERGNELEPDARIMYELAKGVKVRETGLIYKNNDKLVSCSPDGLMPDRGLEIKCPAPKTHFNYLRKNKLPTTYIQQVQGSMWVTGLKKWDFMSYCPAYKPLIITIDADLVFHKKLEIIINSFLKEMELQKKQLKSG